MPDLGNTTVFSQTDASNASGTAPSWSGSAAPSTLDDAGRALQGAVTREWNWRSYTVTAGGTGTAMTLTYSVAPAAYYNGQRFSFLSLAVTGSCSLNVNALGAKTIKKVVAGVLTNLASGDIASGAFVEVAYNTSNDCFVWVNQSGGDVFLAQSNTFTANQIVSTGATDGYFVVTANAAKNKGVIFETGGTNRWIINSDNAAESGTNAGSDFAIYRYDDAGAYVATPFKITRSSGAVTVETSVNFDSLSNFALKKDVGTGNPGILFDTNDYLEYDRTNNAFHVAIGGSNKLTVTSSGVSGTGYTKLGTITTTSGASQALGSLTLTSYKFLRLVFNGVSHNGGSSQGFTVNSVQVANTMTGAQPAYGVVDIDLSTGAGSSGVSREGGTPWGGANTGVTTATTTVTVAPTGGASFDLGSIDVYAL